ncbi:unnamed protein product, partial [Polarella glacialis]
PLYRQECFVGGVSQGYRLILLMADERRDSGTSASVCYGYLLHDVCASPERRTRAQACRLRRKHCVFRAGIVRGAMMGLGPPGLDRCVDMVEFDLEPAEHGMVQSLLAELPQQESSQEGPQELCHRGLEVENYHAEIHEGDAVWDEKRRQATSVVQVDMVQQSEAIEHRDYDSSWTEIGLPFALDTRDGSVASQKREIYTDKTPDPELTRKSIRELALPGMPYISYADAARLSLASSSHLEIISELLASISFEEYMEQTL